MATCIFPCNPTGGRKRQRGKSCVICWFGAGEIYAWSMAWDSGGMMETLREGHGGGDLTRPRALRPSERPCRGGQSSSPGRNLPARPPLSRPWRPPGAEGLARGGPLERRMAAPPRGPWPEGVSTFHARFVLGRGPRRDGQSNRPTRKLRRSPPPTVVHTVGHEAGLLAMKLPSVFAPSSGSPIIGFLQMPSPVVGRTASPVFVV